MKKLFLVFFVLLVGMSGLSAAPSREGGVNDTPQVVIPQADSTASIGAPGLQAPMLPEVELICLWADQYRLGLLTQDEFEALVAGRIDVLRMGALGMRSLAEETRIKVDRRFMYREVELGIQ